MTEMKKISGILCHKTKLRKFLFSFISEKDTEEVEKFLFRNKEVLGERSIEYYLPDEDKTLVISFFDDGFLYLDVFAGNIIQASDEEIIEKRISEIAMKRTKVMLASPGSDNYTEIFDTYNGAEFFSALL